MIPNKAIFKVFVILFFLILFSNPAFGKEACKWNPAKHGPPNLDCNSNVASMGCVEVEAKKDAQLFTTPTLWLHDIRRHYLDKGKKMGFDFPEDFHIGGCTDQNKQSKGEEDSCKPYLKITKNNRSGGGCGCKNGMCGEKGPDGRFWR